jgi:SAM-dependent methyltransferase
MRFFSAPAEQAGSRGDALIDHNNLEAFSDPINYDKEDASDTGVAFYCALAQEAGGSVLEIACGTGRVAIPIAKLGFPVTGLDIVPGMLAQARSKAAGLPARWVEGDARTFDLHEQFHLIFLTGNAFQAFLTNAEQVALLQRVHAHLHDEGLFAFETRNPRWAGLETRAEAYEGLFFNLETRSEEYGWQTYIDVAGHHVRTSTSQVYDHGAQIVHLTGYKRWQEGGEERTQITRTALRYTFPQELAALLHCQGFTLLRQYGDWNLEPLTAASPSIIVVCRKSE